MKKVKRRETGRKTNPRKGLVWFPFPYLRLRLPISTFSTLGQAHSRNPNIDRQQRVVAAATSKTGLSISEHCWNWSRYCLCTILWVGADGELARCGWQRRRRRLTQHFRDAWLVVQGKPQSRIKGTYHTAFRYSRSMMSS